jgi:porphobilinogen synthase
MQFPTVRMRRLRRNDQIRRMVRETTLDAGDLIYPLFVKYGTGVHDEISSMPGVFNLSVDQLEAEVTEIVSLGIPAVILFGIPETKDTAGSGAFAEDGIVQQAIRRIKEVAPELYVITDVCMCEYTSHGHCGALDDAGCVINDVTLEMLAATALSHAEAGADMVAPSDMMDGRVAAIRAALDSDGYTDIPIMSYAAKYASGYYGPFRDAAGSAPSFGDRNQYQMDPANGDEAIRETALDVDEGADIVMVKPALAYMDIIRRVKDTFGMPTAAYNVSGEYAMVKAAAANGWIDEKRVVLETLIGFKRAGADLILTYHAKDAARWLAEG